MDVAKFNQNTPKMVCKLKSTLKGLEEQLVQEITSTLTLNPISHLRKSITSSVKFQMKILFLWACTLNGPGLNGWSSKFSL
jgi:hypothetical protein